MYMLYKWRAGNRFFCDNQIPKKVSGVIIPKFVVEYSQLRCTRYKKDEHASSLICKYTKKFLREFPFIFLNVHWNLVLHRQQPISDVSLILSVNWEHVTSRDVVGNYSSILLIFHFGKENYCKLEPIIESNYFETLLHRSHRLKGNIIL